MGDFTTMSPADFSSSSAVLLQSLPARTIATCTSASSSTSTELLHDLGLLHLTTSSSSSVTAAALLSNASVHPPLAAAAVDYSAFTAETNKHISDVEQKSSSGVDSLDFLGKSVLEQSLSKVTTVADWKTTTSAVTAVNRIPMNQLAKMSTAASTTPAASMTLLSAGDVMSLTEVQPLTDVFVPLETIQPGSLPPVVAYDKNGIRILLHFGKDQPRPDVQVMALSTMSTNTHPITNFSFQAAVPKVMKIKLQPASATDLPAYNPILPAAAITQVMLIALPSQERRIRLKFKLSYTMNGAHTSDVGDIEFSCSVQTNPLIL